MRSRGEVRVNEASPYLIALCAAAKAGDAEAAAVVAQMLADQAQRQKRPSGSEVMRSETQLDGRLWQTSVCIAPPQADASPKRDCFDNLTA